jgi:hypothetical protein
LTLIRKTLIGAYCAVAADACLVQLSGGNRCQKLGAEGHQLAPALDLRGAGG